MEIYSKKNSMSNIQSCALQFKNDNKSYTQKYQQPLVPKKPERNESRK